MNINKPNNIPITNKVSIIVTQICALVSHND